MRVLEAVRLVRAEMLALSSLWEITTKPERVQIALILGRPAELPPRAASPELAWKAMNAQQRRLVLRHAPLSVTSRLPADSSIERRIIWRPHIVRAVTSGAAPRAGGTGRPGSATGLALSLSGSRSVTQSRM